MPSQSLGDALTKANPNNLADALRLVNLGQLFAPVEVVLAETELGTVYLNPLPLCGSVITAVVTSGDHPGVYIVAKDVSPFAATPTSVGVARLYGDSRFITFPSAVWQVKLTYLAAPATPLDSSFAFASP